MSCPVSSDHLFPRTNWPALFSLGWRMWLAELVPAYDLGVKSKLRGFRKAAPSVMYDPMLPLPGLSPVCGKKVAANFDGGLLSSDGHFFGRARLGNRRSRRNIDRACR
jgi:hypothetical protein